MGSQLSVMMPVYAERLACDLLLDEEAAPDDASLAEFTSRFEIAQQLRRLLTQYPIYLPGWTLREVLHHSENAVIFLAENSQGERVAIKRFKFNAKELSGAALEYFMCEAQTLMSQHESPVLVRLLDAGVANGEAVYLVMEYLPGMTLKSRLRDLDHTPLDKVLAWFRQIVQALVIIHESGLLHRDLKSSNVLMRDDDSPAVLDLGSKANC